MSRAAGNTLGDGRYRLEQHLGSGGMASVWLATDERLHRPVAVKAMSDILADDERWLARFRREARAAASLSHPNIVPVFDFGVEDGRPYLVMAYVDGGSLKERLAEGRDVPAAETLARELLGALAHVHAAGILHRDVKPGNVLLDRDGRSHLTDFGIARPRDATAMTQTGMVLGTMRYLAPEVAEGEPATVRSDLYSAGCVLGEVAGERSALGALIERLTDEDPRRRPQSAEEALAALERPGDDATTRVLEPSTARVPPVERRSEPAAVGRRSKGAAVGRRSERAPVGRRSDPAAAEPRSERAAVGRRGGAAPTGRTSEAPRWRLAVAGLAAVALIAVLVVALAGGGSSGGDAASGARLAPAGAPLQDQLRGLDRAIDAAR